LKKSIPSSEEWGLHWAFKVPSLVDKSSFSQGGWPWTLTENAFARDYSYDRGTLPTAHELCSRSFLMMIPSKMSDTDIEYVTSAYRKVANHLP
jgi:hypothetical protein